MKGKACLLLLSALFCLASPAVMADRDFKFMPPGQFRRLMVGNPDKIIPPGQQRRIFRGSRGRHLGWFKHQGRGWRF